MSGLILEICRQSNTRLLEHLIECVCQDNRFQCCSKATCQVSDLHFLVQFNSVNHLTVNEVVSSAFPPLYIHSLLHWKSFAVMITLIGDMENIVLSTKSGLIPLPVKPQIM